MSQTGSDTDALQRAIEAALALIDDSGGAKVPAGGKSLGSLLEQCQAWTRGTAQPAAPVRMIHHFACTGGTVISKALATMPNTVVLSEIDPLNTRSLMVEGKPVFSPTDLIRQLHYSRAGVTDGLVSEMFLASLGVLYRRLTQSGQDLVIRDHSHSHFCDTSRCQSAPTTRDIIDTAHATLSLVTIRHPMASFLSLLSNGWAHFTPGTLEEYARRYLLFLDRYESAPVLRYEDFTHDPEDFLEKACVTLDLAYRSGAPALMRAIVMSGDSGRKGSVIAPRPNREVPLHVGKQISTSPAYTTLCARLSYDPEFK